MKTPDMLKAKLRTREEIKTKTNEYIVKENLKKLGLNKKYYVKTYGCQMNEHDSENIKAILEDMSFTETDDMESADLILLNTCAIRENAHNKVFGMIGRIKNLKESNDALQLRVDSLSEKVETQEKQINEYRKDNLNLKFQFQELQQLFEKLINFLKRMLHRKDKEDVYAEVVGDLYDNQIISEKTFDRITGWDNEKDKQKDGECK